MTTLQTALPFSAIVAGIGTLGLSLWQFSQGLIPDALQSLLAAAAIFGFKFALNQNNLKLEQQHQLLMNHHAVMMLERSSTKLRNEEH
jgi:hypothetical protein